MKIYYRTIMLIAFVFIGILVVIPLFAYLDNPIRLATKDNPLDQKHLYTIILTDGSGSMANQFKPITYAVIKPGEPRSAAGLSWRKIGQSAVDLDDYVNKQVYISGYYYNGMPILLETEDTNPYRSSISQAQPVIFINSVLILK